MDEGRVMEWGEWSRVKGVGYVLQLVVEPLSQVMNQRSSHRALDYKRDINDEQSHATLSLYLLANTCHMSSKACKVAHTFE